MTRQYLLLRGLVKEWRPDGFGFAVHFIEAGEYSLPRSVIDENGERARVYSITERALDIEILYID